MMDPTDYVQRCKACGEEVAILEVDEAKKVCIAVIAQAVSELNMRIPRLRKVYATPEKLEEAEKRREKIAQTIRGAWLFIRDTESNFGWMVAGIGIVSSDARRALKPQCDAALRRLRTFKDQASERNARKEERARLDALGRGEAHLFPSSRPVPQWLQ